MPALKPAADTREYTDLRSQTLAVGERNDCAVIEIYSVDAHDVGAI